MTSSSLQVQRGPIFPRNRLTTGEVLLWEGRPSFVVYFFQPLVLLILTIIFAAAFAIFFPAVRDLAADAVAWAVLVVLLLLMPGVVRRMGLLAAVVGVAVIAFTAAGVVDHPAWGLLLVPVGLAAFLYDYIIWSHTAFAITDRRILTQYGVFNIRFADTRHERISNVTVHQTLFERIFRFGDVMFSTSGETGGIDSNSPAFRADHQGAVLWEDIPHPFEVRKMAEEAILQPAQPAVVYQTVPGPLRSPPASGRGPSISTVEAEERLVKLQQLRDKNLISEEEYEAKRREIISQM